jgi:hypothetical protein
VRVKLERLAQAQLAPLQAPAGRWVAAALGAFALATVVGLVALWPPETEHRRSSVIVAWRDVIPSDVGAGQPCSRSRRDHRCVVSPVRGHEAHRSRS